MAIKVLDPELSKDELAVTRFCREARAAASISHENIVAVHQVEHDEAKDIPFLVMELITGESLEKKLQREGRLSLKEIVSIGMQTAAGLAAAHEKGLIHRDIKPGNILLGSVVRSPSSLVKGMETQATDHGPRTTDGIFSVAANTPRYVLPCARGTARADRRLRGSARSRARSARTPA